MKIGGMARPRTLIILGCVLAVAIFVRAWSIGFGLPALYDPDEPLFILAALKLLRSQTLNPGWFGHPGTTTIYSLALIDLGIVLSGLATGRFANPEAFASAIYADPGVVVLPGRLFVLLCGVLCVALTFAIGRRLFGDRVGLVAAALLALDPLHIQQSQIIRTDVHASLFMLACVLFSIGIVQRGRWIDYLAAGAMVGLACATKWPAVTIIVCPLSACLLRAWQQPAPLGRLIGRLMTVGVASVAMLLVASPYLLLDYPTLIANLQGEARPQHLGSTGGGLLANLGWYLAPTLTHSIGVAGAALAGLGLIQMARRDRTALILLLPAFLVFLFAVAAQALIWARWIVPLLPFAALFAAVGACALADGVARRLARIPAGAVLAALCLLLLVPMAATTAAESRERINDTRTRASAWARAHIPAGSSVVVEHLAFDLLPEGWRFRFPAGAVGCIDGNAMLSGKIQFAKTEEWKKGRAILDLGTAEPARIDACWADYAIISHYDRYRAEPARYPAEIANYGLFFRNGTLLQSFAAQPGVSGGPVVHIVKLNREPPHQPIR